MHLSKYPLTETAFNGEPRFRNPHALIANSIKEVRLYMRVVWQPAKSSPGRLPVLHTLHLPTYRYVEVNNRHRFVAPNAQT